MHPDRNLLPKLLLVSVALLFSGVGFWVAFNVADNNHGRAYQDAHQKYQADYREYQAEYQKLSHELRKLSQGAQEIPFNPPPPPIRQPVTRREILAALGVAVLIAISYPFLAVLAIRGSEWMNSWAYPGSRVKWSESSRLLLGAFWPLTFVVSLIVFLFLGVINRIF